MKSEETLSDLSDLINKALEQARPSDDKPVIIGLLGTSEQNAEMIRKLKEDGTVDNLENISGIPYVRVTPKPKEQ